MPDRYILEILAYHLEACIAAERAGAGRIELCDNAQHGGTTPSFGTIQQAIRSVQIPVFVMIRPRGGHFVYTENEFEAMKLDVHTCKSLGAEGVVFGMLNQDGTVDRERTAKLVDLAYPMDVTFHRAFDYTADPFASLQEIIGCGCTRILTSGQQPTAEKGAPLIRELVENAEERIIIMPGSGIRASNILALQELTGAREFHSSAGRTISGHTAFQQPDMPLPEPWTEPDPGEVTLMQSLLRQQQP